MSVMLVRVDDPEIAQIATAVASRVLRVRHPIPACQRVGVTRPLVIVLGPNVRSADAHLVLEAADQVSAEVVYLWNPVDPECFERDLNEAFMLAARRRFAAAQAMAEVEELDQMEEVDELLSTCA
jgi:hypothetical protein